MYNQLSQQIDITFCICFIFGLMIKNDVLYTKIYDL